MERIEFGCICELAEIMDDYILDNSSEDEYPVVSAYAKCEEAKLLVERLIELGNPIGAILELEDYGISHYNKEYIVYLSEDGVTCEKTYHKDDYYNGGGDISFVHEDCSSKLLNHIDSEFIYEFAVGECDEECDYDCDCDECCDCDEETKLIASTTIYKVDGKEVDEDTYNKALANFNKKYEKIGEKYIENLINASNRYNNWMNSVVKLHKIFHQ